jgi:hypothetical protein
METALLYRRLALALAVREIRRHPHTLRSRAVEYLTGAAPLPAEAPWLLRQALRLLRAEAAQHPASLLARAIAELKAAAGAGEACAARELE